MTTANKNTEQTLKESMIEEEMKIAEVNSEQRDLSNPFLSMHVSPTKLPILTNMLRRSIKVKELE